MRQEASQLVDIAQPPNNSKAVPLLNTALSFTATYMLGWVVLEGEE
jgi:hypothetical protein